MIRPETFARRRERLQRAIPGPVVLMGNTLLPRNSPSSPLPFRQDSTFLYYTGCTRPGAVAMLHAGRFELFLPKPGPDDDLWHGPTPSYRELARHYGAELARPFTEAADAIGALKGSAGKLHTLPVADPLALEQLREWTEQDLKYGAHDEAEGGGSEALLHQVVEQRLKKDKDELAALGEAIRVTGEAHELTRERTRAGATERELVNGVRQTFAKHGCIEAYQPIVTVRGEILHCHDYSNTLEEGQLLLIDAGAEMSDGYSADITRTFPVSGSFDPFQRDVYELVLRSQEAAIAACRPGARYKEVHLEASLVLARGLVEMGFLRGNPFDLVEMGAHAMFFPHGIGHPLGLDVHDLEAYGDRAGYALKRQRSEQFGLKYLRMDRDLSAGVVVTIEPGLYFVPSILKRKGFRDQFREQVDFEKAEQYLDFGGVRIEDDVLVTEDGAVVLSAAIPKAVAEIGG